MTSVAVLPHPSFSLKGGEKPRDALDFSVHHVLDSGASWVWRDGAWVQYVPAPQSVMFGDSPTIDAGGRVRVSNPTIVWDSQFEYNLHPLYYDKVVANNGTVTHNAAHSSANINVTTDSASSAYLQTFEYFRYQPGKSQQIAMTFLFADPTTNLDQRVGQFDDENGFFVEMSDSVISVVRRTKTSGSVVNNKTVKAEWNVDPMDGTGPSGITLDFTKVQQVLVDYQWLSTGRIRYCFKINGMIYLVHVELIANILSVPSVTTPNLPIRWEATTTGVIAGARTLEALCVSVASEGGVQDPLGHTFTGGNGRVLRTGVGSTGVPICSVRPATALNSITNRTKWELESIEIHANDAMYWQLIYAPTGITSASFASAIAHSATEVDIAGTAISGGVIIASGYIAANNKGGALAATIRTKFPFALDAAGTDQSRGYSIVVSVVGAGTNKSAAGQFNWVEIR